MGDAHDAKDAHISRMMDVSPSMDNGRQAILVNSVHYNDQGCSNSCDIKILRLSGVVGAASRSDIKATRRDMSRQDTAPTPNHAHREFLVGLSVY
jgi:hypothetical protein